MDATAADGVLTAGAFKTEFNLPSSIPLPTGSGLRSIANWFQVNFEWGGTPSLEYGLDMSKGTFKAILVVDYTRTITMRVVRPDAQAKSGIPKKRYEIEKLVLKDTVLMIGYVPVWVQMFLELNFLFEFKGDFAFDFTAPKKGVLRLGVMGSPGQIREVIEDKPKPQNPSPTPGSDDRPEDRPDAKLNFEVGLEILFGISLQQSVDVFLAYQAIVLDLELGAKKLAGSLRAAAYVMMSLKNAIVVGVRLGKVLEDLLHTAGAVELEFPREEFLGCWQFGSHLPAGSAWKKICGSASCKSKCSKFADCYERNCGSNGVVGGSCGVCTSPAKCIEKPLAGSPDFKSARCTSPNCPVDYCGLDKALNSVQCRCTGDKKCNTTTKVCETPCEPSCPEGTCGPDGCGGTCECGSADLECVNELCQPKRAETCQPGTCDTEDGDGVCPCADGEECRSGTCMKTCAGACAEETDECRDGVCVCVPGGECDLKACGDDRCGRPCPNQCPAGSGQFCNGGACVECEPRCEDIIDSKRLVCGDDGCGGSCGECPSGQTCGFDQSSCVACTPNCAGKQCGDDGCGGTCGTCPEDGMCSAGVCKARPTQDTCAGRAPADLCQASERDDAFKSQSGKCYCDAYCTIAKDCCADACTTCTIGCSAPD